MSSAQAFGSIIEFGVFLWKLPKKGLKMEFVKAFWRKVFFCGKRRKKKASESAVKSGFILWKFSSHRKILKN